MLKSQKNSGADPKPGQLELARGIPRQVSQEERVLVWRA